MKEKIDRGKGEDLRAQVEELLGKAEGAEGTERDDFLGEAIRLSADLDALTRERYRDRLSKGPFKIPKRAFDAMLEEIRGQTETGAEGLEVVYTAQLEGLVDIVKQDEETAFLVKEDAGLKVVKGMQEATQRFEDDIRPEVGLPFKERLVAFRARYMRKKLPDLSKPVSERGLLLIHPARRKPTEARRHTG